MKLTNEFLPIIKWAAKRGLLNKGNIKTQTIKLQEEIGELAKAVINENKLEIKDAIGDCVIVLTSLADMAGFKIETCIELLKIIC